MIEERIDLIAGQSAAEVLKAIQFESKARRYIFNVYNAEGTPFDKSKIEVANFYVEKTDGTVVSTICDKESLSVVPDMQTFAASGDNKCFLQLIGDTGDQKYDARFGPITLQIRPTHFEKAVESSNDFAVLTRLIFEVSKLSDDFDDFIIKLQSEFNNWFPDFKAESKAEFDEWLSNLKDYNFDDDITAQILSKIATLQTDKANKSELGIQKKVLWNGSLTSNDTTVTLSDDLSNYAMILVVGRANQWGHYPVGVMMPINTIDGAGWHIGTDLNNKLILSTSAELIFQFPTSKSLKSITGFSELNQILTVYGLL